QESTLVAMKPDGVQRQLIGTVIQLFERRGFKLVGMKMLQAPESILAEHYQDLQRNYKSSGPVVAMVRQDQGGGCSTMWSVIGHSDSTEAAPGTIRGDFSIHISRNIIQASDSVEGAQREIQLCFQSSELVNWADGGPPGVRTSSSCSYPWVLRLLLYSPGYRKADLAVTSPLDTEPRRPRV
ncbi:hypothetical protein H1C71_005667, partial [Ictidomys tridecemlineatus]|uniref:Nucleoside diphosphate kinase, mitochondrial n=1 Tax=Ictidomys tridecemlineatus TaxID=43179 RepID=I3N8U6_ICTTR